MEPVWEIQTFGSLSELVNDVNQRGLSGDQFKIVVEPAPSGRGLYHLVHLIGAERDPLLVASAAAPADDTIPDLNEVEEQMEAVDEAEAIIRESGDTHS